MTLKVHIKRLREDAVIPTYAHESDAGVDLYAAESYVLKSTERKLVSTGISIALPPGYEAQVRPKSGLALQHGISIVNTPGTVDADYRGEIGVILINLGNEDYKIEKGKKIAQMIFNKVEHAEFEVVDTLPDTVRGAGGFGSTGV